MPEENKNHHIVIAAAILVVGLLVALYFYGWDELKMPELPSREEVRNNILNGSTIKFTEPSQVESITIAGLPADLQFLVPTEAFGTIIEEQEDASGNTSYKIVFIIDRNMHAYYLKLRADLLSKEWTQLLSSRSDWINILEFGTSAYELRAESTFITTATVTTKNVEDISSRSQRSRVVIQIKQK